MGYFFGRGLNKIQDPYTVIDFYEYYIADKQENDLYYVTYKEYRKIISDYFKQVLENMYKGYTFYIPFGLGKTYIIKKKIGIEVDSLTPDWNLTNKYGKLVYHLNEHSNGYRYNFKWDKSACKNKGHQLYRLVFTRGNKRQLAEYIKTGTYDYIEED